MSWIKEIPFEDANGKLKKLYDKVKGPQNHIDNILKVHSLRPNTLQAHMRMYKNVLHHFQNELSKWFLETLGLYTSLLNGCNYCINHHFAGLKRLLDDDKRANEIRNALEEETFEEVFTPQEVKMLEYAKLLTQDPDKITKEHIKELRNIGYDDGKILEANQVISYFAYANRTALGLGVETNGELLGFSPSDNSNPDNWSHQ